MPSQPEALRRALSPVLSVREFRPLSSIVRVEFAALSHPGRGQRAHEDHYLIQQLSRSQETLLTSLPLADLPPRFGESAYAMLVADGLGGKGPGAVASRLALSTLAHLALHFGRWNVRVDQESAATIVDRAEWFYRRTHDVLRARSLERPEFSGMATSLTAAYSSRDELFVAHAGHSRAYLFRQGELTQLTRDQTPAQQLAAAGRPAPVAAGAEDLGHILTDALGGITGAPQIQIERQHLRHGDCVMLCTDGLSDAVPGDAIADILTLHRSLNEQCRRLVDRALAAGGADNITVVLAQYAIPLS